VTDITTRAGKGAPLTHDEVDQNFLNLKETADLAYDAVASIGGKANATAVGVDDAAANMGTTPGSILSDNGTAKQWFQESEAAIEEVAATANAAVTPAVLQGTLGSREANVLDISGWDGTGANDMATGYQALINQAAIAGVPVVSQGAKILLGSTVILPGAHYFLGAADGELGADQTRTTMFVIGHSGKGFTNAGSTTGTNGRIKMYDFSTSRNQPAVVPGVTYTCGDFDYDFYFPDVSGLHLARFLTLNASKGIYCNGNRNTLEDWAGQCFQKGLHVDWSYDTLQVDRVHLWPFDKMDSEVRSYMQDQMVAFQLNRVDNPMFSNIFSIWHNKAFSIGHFAGDGPFKPAGTVSKLKLSNADLDIGDTAYYVAPAADGHTASWANVSGQGRDTPTNQPLVEIHGPNTRIVGDFDGSNVGGNVVRHEATATGSEISLRIQCKDWNDSGLGYPGVEVVSGGGRFIVLPGSKFTNGNGAENTNAAVPAIASAATIALNGIDDVFSVTGTTNIGTISGPQSYVGRRITLRTASALTVLVSGNIKLKDAVNFAMAAGDTLTLLSDGSNWYEVSRTQVNAWVTSFVPTITATSGAITTSAATCQYKREGANVHFAISITITTNGTGAGTLRATLPFASTGNDNVFIGRDRGVSGKALTATLVAGGSTLDIKNYDNSYPAADGAVIMITGTYRAA
jgi:hypothetical protein